MKKFVLITALVFITLPVFADNSQTAEKTLLILPFHDNSDTNAFGSSGNLRYLTFRSLYTFLGIIPDFNTPDPAELTNIAWTEDGIAGLAATNKADYVVYGNYTYSGTAASARVEVKLNVWSKTDNGNIVKQTYNTTLGIEYLDTVDQMLGEILKNVLNIAMNTASIRFSNFKTGSEIHYVYVNRKLVAVASNASFFDNLRVLADRNYTVEIRRSDNRRSVFNTSFYLSEGQTTNIGIVSTGNIRVKPILYRHRTRNYFILLNDLLVAENERLTNLQAGMDYRLRLVGDQSNVVFDQTYYLHDGESRTLEPRDTTLKRFYSRMYIAASWGPHGNLVDTDSDPDKYPAFGLNYSAGMGGIFLLSDTIWLGFSLNIGIYPSFATLNNSLLPLTMYANILHATPELEFGYYIYGSRQTDLRLALGAGAGMNVDLIFLTPGAYAQMDYPWYFNGKAKVFLQGEYLILFARLEASTGIYGAQQNSTLFVPVTPFQIELQLGFRY